MKRKFAYLIYAVLVGALVLSAQGFAEEKGKEAPHQAPHQAPHEAGHKPHWSYSGEGSPEHWGDLSKDFEYCKMGKSQSPIDIPVKAKMANRTLKVDYKSVPLKIINNGHTIQVNYAPGSTVTIDGMSYDLVQFHFHAPSEHTSGGKHYAMEAHIVHKSADGKLAVIGINMKEGKENKFIKTLWDNLPAKVNEEKVENGVIVNAADLLPKIYPYYYYSGSLTTPPCSEGVSWNVLAAPIEVSKAQVDKFVSLLGNNARPVQGVKDRQVMQSEGDK
jgi:carbonic anhydrase